MNRSWSWRRYWSPWVNLGFLCSSLHIQYQCQQLWDCLYTDAGVLDDNCLAAALRGWNWVFFSPLVAHIVCEALRAGMWETVVIKVFCNSIKDSFPTVAPSALPPSLNCYPTPIPCLSMSVWEPVAFCSFSRLAWGLYCLMNVRTTSGKGDLLRENLKVKGYMRWRKDSEVE